MSLEVILPEKTITIRFKKLNTKPEYLLKNHPLEGGKLNNSIDRIPLPLDLAGDKIEVLSEKERIYLAEKTGRTPDFYSVHNKEGYFRVQGYKDYVVELTKEDMILDLSKIPSFIDYKILCLSPQLVATDPGKVNMYDTVKWYMLEGADHKQEGFIVKQRREAFKLYDKIEGNRYILKYLLNSVGAKTSFNIPLDKLQQMAETKIESNPDMMNVYLKDEYLAYKGVVTEAVELGILQSQGSLINSNETIGKLVFEGQAATMDNIAVFLAEPKNSEIFAKLQALITKENKKSK